MFIGYFFVSVFVTWCSSIVFIVSPKLVSLFGKCLALNFIAYLITYVYVYYYREKITPTYVNDNKIRFRIVYGVAVILSAIWALQD